MAELPREVETERETLPSPGLCSKCTQWQELRQFEPSAWQSSGHGGMWGVNQQTHLSLCVCVPLPHSSNPF